MAAPCLLVIDDDRIYHFLMSRLFDAVDASSKVDQIKACHSAGEALTFLQNELNGRKALLLLDLNMPSMTGFEFLDVLVNLEGIRELCTVYIVTSSVNDSDREKANEYGVVKGYLVKPLKKSVLEEVLQNEA